MAEAARGLAGRGYRVDLLTTCALSHFSWENKFEPGVSVEAGVTIRRFRTVMNRSLLVAHELEHRVQSGEKLTASEEIAWVNGRFRVPDLYLYLTARARSYDAIVFSPYLFWSTIYGAEVAPERSIIMPCLHDEPYAHLGVVASTLTSVAGVWFLSEPEHQLGHRLAPGIPPRHSVVGAAVDAPVAYDPAGFRQRHGLTRPFILYAGRREQGKGWSDLLAYFAAALVGGSMPFDLVSVGVGVPKIPVGLRDRVIDLGYLSPEEMPSAFAAAEALMQPSTNESFSRTIMEAWLARTPVIASARGEVVTWHCERSGGGLTYIDSAEFTQCLRFLAEAPKAAATLAEKGHDYVVANYSWNVVLDAMEASLASFHAKDFA
jgi:glycosyltransferase involved in cell wall biosynthesis